MAMRRRRTTARLVTRMKTRIARPTRRRMMLQVVPGSHPPHLALVCPTFPGTFLHPHLGWLFLGVMTIMTTTMRRTATTVMCSGRAVDPAKRGWRRVVKAFRLPLAWLGHKITRTKTMTKTMKMCSVMAILALLRLRKQVGRLAGRPVARQQQTTTSATSWQRRSVGGPRRHRRGRVRRVARRRRRKTRRARASRSLRKKK
mmetsp:Transcript_5620/g.11156  ORF Transcript_5620/g.11156 Transcript_5620/m.11156 type:complete len:201 (+) Transcript_5620:532-1134(+)